MSYSSMHTTYEQHIVAHISHTNACVHVHAHTIPLHSVNYICCDVHFHWLHCHRLSICLATLVDWLLRDLHVSDFLTVPALVLALRPLSIHPLEDDLELG